MAVGEDVDTIVAVATPPGIGGIAVVRLSGPEAFSVVSQVVQGRRGPLVRRRRGWEVHLGRAVDGQGQVIDEVIVTWMPAPFSYTREDVAEISCHGGMAAVQRVLSECLRRGARLAEPGEFTRRAFVNGRIDLAQAEAVLSVVEARSDAGLRMAVQQMDGALSRAVKAMRRDLLGVVSEIEATVDFPDEDIPVRPVEQVQAVVADARQQVEALLATAPAGRAFHEGVTTAIVGRPNAGKSSLLNALVQQERAIVTEVPGTTRDVVEEWANLDGVPVRLWDTAGIRRPADRLEQAGVERARAALQAADLLLLVVDGSQPLSQEDWQIRDMVAAHAAILVLNKADLGQVLTGEELQRFWGDKPRVRVSAKTGLGMDNLRRAVVEQSVGPAQGRLGAVVVINARHEHLLRRAAEALAAAEKTLADGMPMDLASGDLRLAVSALGEIVGESVGEELLDEIFGRFCIGK
ncbi:MAG: tRNA uridine-5-carboxymethylaminomethyl(34) synthesis GTPase MnmE [Firmicutes bacterium]|nr:tRNA uridine-5-carboxymethylaminomethyl(34) synthesis GTPase MnmE [Bacillota bacterium]